MELVKEPLLIDGIPVIQDIDEAVNAIRGGNTVARFEWGDSMTPILVNGQYGKLTPIPFMHRNPQAGDAVLCNVGGTWMTHMVWIVNEASGQCLIGSTQGQLYGWTSEIIAIVSPLPYKEKEEF